MVNADDFSYIPDEKSRKIMALQVNARADLMEKKGRLHDGDWADCLSVTKGAMIDTYAELCGVSSSGIVSMFGLLDFIHREQEVLSREYDRPTVVHVIQDPS